MTESPVLHLNEETFSSTLASEKRPIVVDFWATWCGPCKAVGPVFEELAAEMTNVCFAKVNIEEAQAIAGEYGIRSVPTFVVIKDGQMVGSFMGALPKNQLKTRIEEHVG